MRVAVLSHCGELRYAARTRQRHRHQKINSNNKKTHESSKGVIGVYVCQGSEVRMRHSEGDRKANDQLNQMSLSLAALLRAARVPAGTTALISQIFVLRDTTTPVVVAAH